MWKNHPRTPQQHHQHLMTVERGERPLSPVHVHVDDRVPLHVHLKKPKKPVAMQDKLGDQKFASSNMHGSSSLRRSGNTRSRSKSPGPPGARSSSSGRWIPPPGKSTKGVKYTWQISAKQENPVRDVESKNKVDLQTIPQSEITIPADIPTNDPSPSKIPIPLTTQKGPSHRLEIGNPSPGTEGTMRMSDLETDEEDQVANRMRSYERKIDGLMSQVGSLRNEVDLQRTLREMEHKDDLLETSRRELEDQEDELYDIQSELKVTENENKKLRKSVNFFRGSAEMNLTDKNHLEIERDSLMKQLVEVEMDGQAAVKQSVALRDATRRLKEEKRLTSGDVIMLSEQKDLLLERIRDFEGTNRALRRMLRDRHEQEATSLHLGEQRDVLLKKLTETAEDNQALRVELMARDRMVTELRLGIDAQRDENVAVSGLQSSLEKTRGHLQKQLKTKDADCNRMAVQIRSLESELAQDRIEIDHLRELLSGAKHKADRDKEALKKATRVQKQRATKSEDAVGQLNVQMMEREGILAEMRSELDGVQAHCDKMGKEKAQAVAEATALQIRVSELENILERIEDDSKLQVDSATRQLHDKSTETSSLRIENQRLKTSLGAIEDRLTHADSEMSQLRGNLHQYETLVDEYRSQMNRSRKEADESIIQLEDQKQETQRVKSESEHELEKVKARLQARLKELESIPELLKTTEMRLHKANEILLTHEKRNADSNRLIAELTAKVEQKTETLNAMRSNFQSSQEEGRSVSVKADSMEKKLCDVEDLNRDLHCTVAKREEGIHQANIRLDDLNRENASLNRQLEAALTESRRVSEQARDKSSAKDRAMQTRVLDLESQLSQTRAEIARVKREKEEAERKFNSRLYDLKDRLDQSHSTNRSMQNYVQFLKNSYANVFSDNVIPPCSPLRGSGFP